MTVPAFSDLTNVCIVVSSSDNTWDIAKYTIRAFNYHWAECPFPVFIGINTEKSELENYDYLPLYAPKSNWSQELRAQIAALPDKYRYVILFLDDFVLYKPVDNKRLLDFVRNACDENWAYLRLTSLKGSLFSSIGNALINLIKQRKIREIPTSSPYFSSLQVSVWNRSHIMNLLDNGCSIWDFEKQSTNEHHYAICGSPPIHYIHVVERGIWQSYAESVLLKSGLTFDPGTRDVRIKGTSLIRLFRRLKFFFVGYAGYHIRRALLKYFIV